MFSPAKRLSYFSGVVAFPLKATANSFPFQQLGLRMVLRSILADDGGNVLRTPLSFGASQRLDEAAVGFAQDFLSTLNLPACLSEVDLILVVIHLGGRIARLL